MRYIQPIGTQTAYVAVGTSLGELALYGYTQQRLWLRTVNTAITSLTATIFPHAATAILVGTDTGLAIAFTLQGKRHWTHYLSLEANHPVVSLSVPAIISEAEQPSVAVTVARSEQTNDIIILNSSGQEVKTIREVEPNTLSQLLDVNRDGHTELLVVNSDGIALLGLGLDVDTYARGWSYELAAMPTTFLVADLTQEGQEVLLAGGEDGRLHALESSGKHRWVVSLQGGFATHLATLLNPRDLSAPRSLVIAYQSNNPEESHGGLELRQANGDLIWQHTLTTAISSLQVIDLDGQDQPEIVAGLQNGQIVAFEATGTILWQTTIADIAERGTTVAQLRLIEGVERSTKQLLAVTEYEVFSLTGLSQANVQATPLLQYDAPLIALYETSQPGEELATAFITLTQNGTVRGYTKRGIRLPYWPHYLIAPTISLPAVEDVFDFDNADIPEELFLIATSNDTLVRLELQNNLPSFTSWRLPRMGTPTNLYWGDVNRDRQPDVVISNQSGQIGLFNREMETILSEPLNLTVPIFAVTALHYVNQGEADLIAITNNGPNSQVVLFRAQENQPPLLMMPQFEVREGQYSIGISVQDVEEDEVTVRLEVQDSNTQIWFPQEARQLTNGNGDLFWPAVPITAINTPVSFRFRFTDGFHDGIVMPAPGPEPIIVPPLVNLSRIVIGLSGGFGFILIVLFVWQMQSPASRAGRFYRRLQRQPAHSLTLLEHRYRHTAGSPDFLLHLAREARQNNDKLIAGLSDGLFLLTDQPHAGLPILTTALKDADAQNMTWTQLDRWLMTYQTCAALLEAPSLTELTLLRPKLVSLLNIFKADDDWVPILDSLLPILTNLRDSERVDLVEDRLIYLQEAALQLRQNQEQLPQFSLRPEKVMVAAILQRWAGMVSARIEELRGQATLEVILKTHRLIPTPEVDVSIEVANIGRAAAEHIVITLKEAPTYQSQTASQLISLLLPGRRQIITFHLRPHSCRTVSHKFHPHLR